MLANEKPELLAASESLYKYNNEETIRWQCYAREEYRRDRNTIERDRKRLAELEKILAEKDIIISEKDASLSAQADYIAELETKLAQNN